MGGVEWIESGLQCKVNVAKILAITFSSIFILLYLGDNSWPKHFFVKY